jgi:dihydrofolate reductase/thymidylate synthase
MDERAFQIVVAYNTSDQGIGVDGGLPWKLPGDLSFFKALTSRTSAAAACRKTPPDEAVHKRNALVMGRRTWDSIPAKSRPLPGRLNVVLTRSPSPETALGYGFGSSEDVVACTSLRSALQMLASSPYSSSIETVFVIGGGQVYK